MSVDDTAENIAAAQSDLDDAIAALKAAVVDQEAGLALMPAGAKTALVEAVKTYNEAQAAAEALLER